MSTDYSQRTRSASESWRPKRTLWVAAAMIVLIGAFYLLREHWGHVAGYWPYLLLLACPLMHLFHGHGSHGRHSANESGNGRKPNQES